MERNDIPLSRRSLLAGLGTVGLASAGAGLGTTALFNDTESLDGNSLTAGELDLVVDYYTDIDQGSAGGSSQQGTVNGNGQTEYTYTVSDVKPGDSGTLAFCPKLVTNDGWLWVGSDGVTDYENGQTEPESEVDGSGGGTLGSTETGAGFGELADELEITVSYASDVSLSGDTVDCDVTRELNNPAGYSLADLAKELTAGFLLDGDQNESTANADPTPYPGSADATDQQGPCLCIEWELPTDVGNEVQTDGLSFGFTFAAEQSRNNADPVSPFVDTLVESGGSIQSAVDAASAGDVVGVASGTFTEQVTVDKAVTLVSTGATVDGGGSGPPFTVAADGVTINGFEITNPGGLLGISVDPGVDDVTICDNRIFDIGPTGNLGVTGIIFGTEATGGHQDVTVVGNVIETLRQEDDGSFATINGILFNSGSSPGTISDVVVADNVLRDFESTTAPIGIDIQQNTENVFVEHNEFSDFLADNSLGAGSFTTFAQGLSFSNVSNTNVAVVGNVFGDDILSNDGFYPEAIKIAGTADVSGIRINRNDLLTAFGVNSEASGTVDAEDNYWNDPAGPNTSQGQSSNAGLDTRPSTASVALGNVDSDPFLTDSIQ